MRTEDIMVREYGCWEISPCFVLEKDELDKIDTRVLLAQRPHGISFMDKDEYVGFYINYNNRAVRVGDYLDVMKTRPHIPNKKEARKIRQEKAKNRK
jgi:hypothetical protein